MHTVRMGSTLTTIGLPVALGIIMFGLGLSLTLGDFARVGKHPKAVIIALVCQLILLPAICLGLVYLFQLPPILAVGMMLLAASPGGTTANLYSHLFRGDVALNISLTAINSVIAVFTLPLITNFAILLFLPEQEELGRAVRQGRRGVRDRAHPGRDRHARALVEAEVRGSRPTSRCASPR